LHEQSMERWRHENREHEKQVFGIFLQVNIFYRHELMGMFDHPDYGRMQ